MAGSVQAVSAAHCGPCGSPPRRLGRATSLSCPPTKHPLIKPSAHEASMASCSTPAVQYWMCPLSRPHILAHPLEEQGKSHLLCRYWMARTICKKIWRASASL